MKKLILRMAFVLVGIIAISFTTRSQSIYYCGTITAYDSCSGSYTDDYRATVAVYWNGNSYCSNSFTIYYSYLGNPVQFGYYCSGLPLDSRDPSYRIVAHVQRADDADCNGTNFTPQMHYPDLANCTSPDNAIIVVLK